MSIFHKHKIKKPEFRKDAIAEYSKRRLKQDKFSVKGDIYKCLKCEKYIFIPSNPNLYPVEIENISEEVK